MRIELEIPQYEGHGIEVFFEKNARYAIKVVDDRNIYIHVNKEGLITLAKQMLYFAYNDLPEGSHVHYDGFLTNDYENAELVIEKMN